MTSGRHEKGLQGERQAEGYLTEVCGMTCLNRRYRSQDGEIDLIMRDGEVLVFVEVKFRPGGRAGDGLLAVTSDKRRRMIHAALGYLAEMGDMARPVRFDVVEITQDGLRHLPNAFDGAQN